MISRAAPKRPALDSCSDETTPTEIDIRTLPLIRFEDNGAHAQLYGVNFGETVRGIGPDAKRPFILKNTLLWNNFLAFRAGLAIDARGRHGCLTVAMVCIAPRSIAAPV